MKFILLTAVFFCLPSFLIAQAGLGKLDHNGKNSTKPTVQKSIVPQGAKKAWHFVLPGGSCEREDCGSDRERSQLIQSRPDNVTGQAYRYSFLFFLPQNFSDVSPANTMLWEVKPFGSGKPSILVEIINKRLKFSMSDPSTSQKDKMRPEKPKIIKVLGGIPRGKWTEMVIDIHWSSQNDGVLIVYHNGKKVVQYKGANTESGVRKQAVMFGIYRSFISRYTARNGVRTTPMQEAFFANVNRQLISFGN